MPEYQERFYTSAEGLKLYYRDYSGPSEPTPVLCIPGLTRNSRDFEAVASHVARTRRVLAADLRGRGKSAYDPQWKNYAVQLEAADMTRLMDDAGVNRVVVLGTSRGAIVGMLMGTFPGVVSALILNDLGAELGPLGLDRILESVGNEPTQPNWDAAAAALELKYGAMFPGLPQERWLAFARALYREEGGILKPDYDPKIGDAMRMSSRNRQAGTPSSLWPLFDNVLGCPTLVIRGENSDLLSAETVDKMKAMKPDLHSAVVRNRGHVPFLDEPEALAAIDDFLETLTDY